MKDTIIAQITPNGYSAIGVIRISGFNTFNFVTKVFSNKKFSKSKSHSILFGNIIYNGTVYDEVLIYKFIHPNSFTGEDIVEISCHGSPYVLNSIIQLFLTLGCSLAKPGEFSQRAFLNGKLDLMQTESISDLIFSTTESSRDNAIKYLKGGFSKKLLSIREELIKISALLELELDFSMEDVEFVGRKELYSMLEHFNTDVTKMLESFKYGNALKNGFLISIVGKPNAGKSTLLNTLLNDAKSIVSDIPGTTRDIIEDTLIIKGLLFRIADTAGLNFSSNDEIELIGIDRSWQKIKQSDLVLILFDVNTASDTQFLELVNSISEKNSNILLVGNKIDIVDFTPPKTLNNIEIVSISAKNNIGIENLTSKIHDTIIESKKVSDSMYITNQRHFDAFYKIHSSITSILKLFSEGVSVDLIAVELKECIYQLGLLTGTISNEEQLDFIFSKFCIGK